MITNTRSIRDIEACVDAYISIIKDKDFDKFDREYAIRVLMTYSRSKSLLKIKIENEKVVAFIIAIENRSIHKSGIILQQAYFCTTRSGIKAYRDIVDLHKEMETYAKIRNIRTLISTSSHNDPDFVFSRILEKNGWKRKGYLAKKEL